MGLNDIAMFRTLNDCVVLYPADAVATEKLVHEAALHQGNVYLRLTRNETPVIYDHNEHFVIGGSKILRESTNDAATVIAAGITVYEALAAHGDLKAQGISIRVIDLYSVKPIDQETVKTAARATGVIISVEDHCAEGGIGEAVMNALAANPVPIYMLAVRKTPRSGEPGELLDYEGISRYSIVQQVKEVLSQS
jgi:transketolase